MNNNDRFKQTYITECFDLLVEMEEHLLALDLDNPDNELLNAIFRCAHSIKGGSGAFGFDYITNFAHVLEALLDSLREGKVMPSREIRDSLLKSTDILTQMTHAAKNDTRPPDNLGEDLKKVLEQFAQGKTTKFEDTGYGLFDDESTVSEKEQTLWRIDFMPLESLFLTGNEPLFILRELASFGAIQTTVITEHVPEIAHLDPTLCYLGWSLDLTTDKDEAAIREVFEFVTDHCFLKIEPIVKTSANNAKAKSDKSSTEENKTITNTNETRPNPTTSIRVDLDKIDRLVNIVGELVITEAMIKAQTRGLSLEQHTGLMRGIDELSQHTRELQEAVMGVRMQPVRSVFSRMPRIVHDLSEQLGKNIRLISSGESTEVDKTVIDQIADPLTHMIRNSCDHGIELPGVRVANGKSEQGTIHLSANHRGGRIIIEISDDGAGIDRGRVLAKAQDRGLVATDAKLTNEEIDELVFMPGLSTAEKLTNVSGRGVGMDVVKRNIEGMGGNAQVTNEPGKGTLFKISLPLTLAILDGMIVRVGKEHYIIPITDIIETLRPKPDVVRHLEGHSDIINVRGEFISVIYLHRIFNTEDAQGDPSKALVVIVESNRQKIGLVVDELIGQQQVVIKSLEANAGLVRGISGATILGDGRVSLILEINDLAKMYQAPSSQMSLEQVI